MFEIKVNKYVSLIPTVVLVVFLYSFWSLAFQYPGGTRFDETTTGFGFVDNYWCDLMLDPALNGEHNPAASYAILAWVILNISVAFFFWIIPVLFETKKSLHKYIQLLGLFAFLGIAFAFTAYHDIIVYTCFGPAAMATLIGVKEFLSEKRYFESGLLIFMQLLCLYVWFSYVTGIWDEFLPAIQKITFVVITVVFGYFNWKIYQQLNKKAI